MGQRGPSPAYDVGAFVLAVELGASHAELAERYGITVKAVERRIHRLRVLGALRPAPGRARPGGEEVAAREARAAERQRRRDERERRAQRQREEWGRLKAEQEAEAAERERIRLADQESARRRREELEWHARRQTAESARSPQGPVLDLLG